jgi:hypothetical protein
MQIGVEHLKSLAIGLDGHVQQPIGMSKATVFYEENVRT